MTNLKENIDLTDLHGNESKLRLIFTEIIQSQCSSFFDQVFDKKKLTRTTNDLDKVDLQRFLLPSF